MDYYNAFSCRTIFSKSSIDLASSRRAAATDRSTSSSPLTVTDLSTALIFTRTSDADIFDSLPQYYGNRRAKDEVDRFQIRAIITLTPPLRFATI